MRNEKDLVRLLQENRWLVAAFLLGLLLLILPGKTDKKSDGENIFSQEEQRLCRVLSQIDGVGETAVLLSRGAGRDDDYLGAVIVCSGADSDTVRLRVVETVMSFTGLSSNNIVVQNMSITGGTS